MTAASPTGDVLTAATCALAGAGRAGAAGDSAQLLGGMDASLLAVLQEIA